MRDRPTTTGMPQPPLVSSLCTLLLLCVPASVLGARGGVAGAPEERRCATSGTAYSSCFAPNLCCGNTIGAGCRPPDATCCGENKFCQFGHSCCGDSCCKDDLGECCGGKCCLTRIPQPFMCTADLRCVKRRGSDDADSSSAGAQMSSTAAAMWPFSSSAASLSSTAGIADSSSAESLSSSAAADASSSAPDGSSSADEASSSAEQWSSSEPAASSSAEMALSSSAESASSSADGAPVDSSTGDTALSASSSTADAPWQWWLSSTADQEEQPAWLDNVAREDPSDGNAPNITNVGDSPSASTTKTGAVGAILALIGGFLGIAFLCNVSGGTGTVCCCIKTGGQKRKARSSPDGDPSPTESNIAVFAQVAALAFCVASVACDRYASLRYNIVTAFYGLDHITFRLDGDYGPGGEQRTTESEDFQCGNAKVQEHLDASQRACVTLAALSAVVFILIVAATILTLRCCLELMWLRLRNMPLRVSSQLTTGIAAKGRPGQFFNFVSCQWAATVSLGAAWSTYLWGPFLLLQESLGNTDARARLEVGWILCLVAFGLQLPQAIYWPKLEWTETEAAANKLTAKGTADSSGVEGAVTVQMAPLSSPSAASPAVDPPAREAWGTPAPQGYMHSAQQQPSSSPVVYHH